MDDQYFIFSLYPKDLICIQGKNKIKLNPVIQDKDAIEVEEIFAYYIKAGISGANIAIQTNDNKYEQLSLGIKGLKKLEKYEVDILGNYHKVKFPEKRLPFNINKNSFQSEYGFPATHALFGSFSFTVSLTYIGIK